VKLVTILMLVAGVLSIGVERALNGRAVPVRVRVSVINDTAVNGVPTMAVVNRMVSGPVIVAVVALPVYIEVATETTVPVWTTPLLVRVKVEIGL
jgi:hypothetical protein